MFGRLDWCQCVEVIEEIFSVVGFGDVGVLGDRYRLGSAWDWNQREPWSFCECRSWDSFILCGSKVFCSWFGWCERVHDGIVVGFLLECICRRWGLALIGTAGCFLLVCLGGGDKVHHVGGILWRCSLLLLFFVVVVVVAVVVLGTLATAIFRAARASVYVFLLTVMTVDMVIAMGSSVI